VNAGKKTGATTPRPSCPILPSSVRFTTPHRVEPALFDGLPVEGLGTEDRITTLLTPRPEEVLKRLFESGASVSDLEVVGADLEEAFLQITKEGTNEEEGPP
jgi:hypothetical protein